MGNGVRFGMSPVIGSTVVAKRVNASWLVLVIRGLMLGEMFI
jgi:hypothetical protein